MSSCGNAGPSTQTAEEIMQPLAPEERARAIYEVLMEEPLSSARVIGLTYLLGATADPMAIAYLSDVFDAAQAIAERHVRINMQQDPATRGPLVANQTSSNRRGVIEGARIHGGPEAAELLQRAAGSEDPAAPLDELDAP
jgi:hypothetical protein